MYPANSPTSGTLAFTDEWAQQIQWINNKIGGTTNGGNWQYSNTLSPGSWYFVAMTSTPTGGLLYVNGQVVATISGAASQGSPLIYFGGSGGSGGPGCCGYNFNGMITNAQIYDTVLSPSQITMLYQEGPAGVPVLLSSLVGWWPLNGNANNYAGTFYPGYPINVIYNPMTYNALSLQNAFSISSQSVPVPVLNYSTGKYKLYNIGVYSWR